MNKTTEEIYNLFVKAGKFEEAEMNKTTKEVYNIFVKGDPKAQPRPRLGKYGNFYSRSPTVDAWKEDVKVSFVSRRPTITDPVHLKVYFFMPVAKGMKNNVENGRYVPHTVKPDADNLLKPVMDALTETGVWKDDSLAFWVETAKWYAAEETGAQIIIETWRNGILAR